MAEEKKKGEKGEKKTEDEGVRDGKSSSWDEIKTESLRPVFDSLQQGSMNILGRENERERERGKLGKKNSRPELLTSLFYYRIKY